MIALTLALALQHGGKLPWIAEYEKGITEMKDAGGGAVVYFTKDG